MLREQIEKLDKQIEDTNGRIEELEEILKATKNELNVIKKAKKSLERYEEQLNEAQTESSCEHTNPNIPDFSLQ